MKRHLTSILFGPILLLGHFMFVETLSVSTADARAIAFSSDRSGNANIYVMDTNGKNLQQLTDHPGNEYAPAFSPDGQQMAYMTTRHDGYQELYVMNLQTKVSHRLTNHPKHDDSPAWSPDGRWIAFVSNRTATYHIYKIEPDGKNLQQLTHEQHNHHDPDWSPDGQFIAFSSGRKPSGIYIMDADGTNPRRLANQPNSGYTPSWSPDGTQIAFSDNMILGGHRDLLFRMEMDVYTLNVDGSGLKRLTRHPADDWAPRWSPDGRSIVYASVWNQQTDIYLIAPGLGRQTGQLTRDPARDVYPTWVPSGFFDVSPGLDTQSTLWGRLKQSVGD